MMLDRMQSVSQAAVSVACWSSSQNNPTIDLKWLELLLNVPLHPFCGLPRLKFDFYGDIGANRPRSAVFSGRAKQAVIYSSPRVRLVTSRHSGKMKCKKCTDKIIGRHEKGRSEFTPNKSAAQQPPLQCFTGSHYSLIKPARQQTAHLITVMSFHYCVAFMTVAMG